MSQNIIGKGRVLLKARTQILKPIYSKPQLGGGGGGGYLVPAFGEIYSQYREDKYYESVVLIYLPLRTLLSQKTFENPDRDGVGCSIKFQMRWTHAIFYQMLPPSY